MKPKWCCSEAKKAEGNEIVFYAPVPTDENITPVRLDAKFFLLCRNNNMKEIQYCPWCGKEFEVTLQR